MPTQDLNSRNGFSPRPGTVHRPTRSSLPMVEGPSLPHAPDYSTSGTVAKGAPRPDAYVSQAKRATHHVGPIEGFDNPLPAVSPMEAVAIAREVLTDHGMIGHVMPGATITHNIVTIPVVCTPAVAVRMAQVLRVHGNPGVRLPQERRFHTHVRNVPGEPVAVIVTVRAA